MSETKDYCTGGVPRTTWWRNPKFPLIPWWILRPAVKSEDKGSPGSARHFSFRWTFITLWSLEHFSLEVSTVIDAHWGIGFVGTFGWLRWSVTIPLPYSTFDFLRRKP